jgi:hypothetical protein
MFDLGKGSIFKVETLLVIGEKVIHTILPISPYHRTFPGRLVTEIIAVTPYSSELPRFNHINIKQ